MDECIALLMDETTADVREAEAAKLKELFDAQRNAKDGLSQAQFGSKHGIGTGGMVWQYISGHRPLNLQAAVRFARAFGVGLSAFSPRLAREALEAAAIAGSAKAPAHSSHSVRELVRPTAWDWPFLLVTKEQLDKLSQADRGRIEGYVMCLIELANGGNGHQDHKSSAG